MPTAPEPKRRPAVRRARAVLCMLALLLLPLCRLRAAEAEAPAPPEPEAVAAAIEGALDWLAENQIREGELAGSWECKAYRNTVASFAGLAFLANGHIPGEGERGRVVERALQYVMGSMGPDGYLGGESRSGMYTHAICTLFGLSCLGMAPEPEKEVELAQWCRKAVRVIVEAHEVNRQPVDRGGWRYTPDTAESDLSVTSWQLVALHAARQCGFEVDRAILQSALDYVNRAYVVTEPEGEDAPVAGFLYLPGVSKEPEPGVTGVAVFVKCLLEKEPDEKVARSLAFLERFQPAWGGPQYHGYFFFAAFYMTQGMFQVGGEHWERYRPQMQRVLLEHQLGDGRWPFPENNAPQSRYTGPAYPTSLAVLILSLEKQYLPMYQRQKAIF
jgi:hypothetical protein